MTRTLPLWLRWIAWIFPALAALLVLLFATTPWTVPALLHDRAQQWITQSTGREATIGPIAFNPLSLRLRVKNLRVRNAGNTEDALRIASGELRLSWQSLWSGKLHITSLTLDQPQLRIVREPSGRFDFDDVLKRLRSNPSKPGSAPPAFALRDMHIKNGSVVVDDQTAKVVTRLTDLDMRLPRLSTLPGDNQAMQLRATAKLDGAPLRLTASGAPFDKTAALRLDAELQGLDLTQSAAYQPTTLPVRLVSGALSAKLQTSIVPAQPDALDIHGSVQLRNGAVQSRAGRLATWKTLDIDLSQLRPLQRVVQLETVRVDGLSATLSRSADGIAGFGRGRTGKQIQTQAPNARPPASRADQSPAPADAAPQPKAWSVRIGTLDLPNSRLHWSDSTVRPAVDWNFAAPTLRLSRISWPIDAPVEFEADIDGPQGLGAQIRGRADLREVQAAIAASHADPAFAAPYVASARGESPLPRGLLDAKATLTWKTKDASLALDVSQAQWTGFAWGPSEGGVQAHDIVLGATRLHWAAQPQALLLDVGHLRIDSPSAGQNAALRATRLDVSQARVDLRAHTVRLGSVRIVEPQASIARDPTGQWSFSHWLPSGLLPAPRAGAASTATPTPWHIDAQQAQIQGGRFYLADTKPKKPVVVALTGVDLDLQNLDWPQTRPAGVTLAAQISDELPASFAKPSADKKNPTSARAAADGAVSPVAPDDAAPASGMLRFSGQIQAEPFVLRGKLDAKDLPAQLAASYLPARVNAEVLRAPTSAKGDLQFGMSAAGPDLTFEGQASVNHFLADTLEPRERLLGWNSLQLNALRIAHKQRPGHEPATAVDIGQIALRDFYARVVLDQHAKFNLVQVFKPLSAQEPASGKNLAPAPKPHDAALRINVGGITLAGGRVDYTDHFVQPNYATNLTGVEGKIGAFSSAKPAPAPVDLRATAEGTAPVALHGVANPLTTPPVLDLRGQMSGLQLAPLSPYSGRYAGYNIKRGVLSMNVHYDVNPSGQLKADNQLVLNQLTFGDRVDSPEATKLPVLLAVDLLKDSAGNITVNIPISGSLNDPDFSLGSVIAKAVVNLLARAITAPFSLLGHMFAGGATAEQLSHIAFVPGTDILKPGEAVKLQDIAKALQAKPQLILTITGEVDPTAERETYRQARLEQQMLAAWKHDLPRAEAFANAKVQNVPAADRAKALATVYRQTPLPNKPRDALGLPKTLPESDMQRLLLQNIPASEDRMQALAMQRAVALRAALDALGVPGARQFIAAPILVDKPPPGWTPQASLSLTLP